MKLSPRTDLICLNKILRYIALINKTYNKFEIKSINDLESDEVCQLAIAQAVTNIYEAKKIIRPITLLKAPAFDKILLKAARNIASHDYDSLDFEIIYKRTMQLLKSEVLKELEAIIHDLEQHNQGNKKS